MQAACRAARAEGLPSRQLGGHRLTQTRPVALGTGWGASRAGEQQERGTADTTSQPPSHPAPGLPAPCGEMGFSGSTTDIQTRFWQLPGCMCPPGRSPPMAALPPWLPAAHVCCPAGSCGQERRQRCPGQVRQSHHTRPPLAGHGDRCPLAVQHPRWAGTGTVGAKPVCRRTARGEASHPGRLSGPFPSPLPRGGPKCRTCQGRRPLRPQRRSRQECRGREGQGVSSWSGKGQGGDRFWSQV